MKDDNIEFDLMYDLTCWHCKRFHEDKCKGKPSSITKCVSYEEYDKKEVKNGRK